MSALSGLMGKYREPLVTRVMRMSAEIKEIFNTVACKDYKEEIVLTGLITCPLFTNEHSARRFDRTITRPGRDDQDHYKARPR